MKIAVAGIGGVGGYLGGMLARTLPDVTFVARGKKLEDLRENGLPVESDYQGTFTARPAAAVEACDLPVQDIIFVCVKNYSLEEMMDSLQGAIDENTIIVPVMNGIDPGDRIREMGYPGQVVDGVIYIVSYREPDGTLRQLGDYAYLRVGNKERNGKADIVCDVLNQAGVDCEVAQDIEREIWLKFILNCGYNVESAYYDETIGELRSDPEKAREYEDLTRESYALALAKGVDIRESDIETIIDKFYHLYTDEMTSSLQRDLREGHPHEGDTFSGYVVREAEKLGLSLPVSKKMAGRFL